MRRLVLRGWHLNWHYYSVVEQGIAAESQRSKVVAQVEPSSNRGGSSIKPNGFALFGIVPDENLMRRPPTLLPPQKLRR